MPPKYLYDIAGLDLEKTIHDKAFIREIIPHRGEIEQLDGIIYEDESVGRMVGYKQTRTDEFWVEGHIPGRPLYPGVLMIEAAAQLASFYMKHLIKATGFIGFGGVDNVRFRQAVTPGQRMYILLQKNWIRHGRFHCTVQGVVNGVICFEGDIIGVQMG